MYFLVVFIPLQMAIQGLSQQPYNGKRVVNGFSMLHQRVVIGLSVKSMQPYDNTKYVVSLFLFLFLH